MKRTVLRYAREIDALVRETRARLSSAPSELEAAEVLALTEDVFFSSESMKHVEICSIKDVIESVYERSLSRFGILKPYLDNPAINEIMVNGPEMIFVEENGEVLQIDNAFTSCEELEDTIRMFAADVHREVNEANPIVDARLDSGYRVNGVLKNVAINGPTLTIRKFSRDSITLRDLISYGSITEECCRQLIIFVKSGYNLFISGGTSSGKTTFLNALTYAVDPSERAIIIEDSSELRVDHLNNIVHMECRNANSVGKGAVTMEQLIKTSLRMRPDRIIVGEVRGREVIDMLQAMSTGHDGSMSTGHGNSIKGMLSRLETMYLMDSQVPIYSIKSQIANAIDIFIHLKKDSDGRRRVVELAEIERFDGTDYVINYLFKLDERGQLAETGHSLVNREKLRRSGYESLL